MKIASINESETEKFIYRGMSNEEWAEAIERGYVLSDCRYATYEGQENISCFGDLRTAEHYALEIPIYEPEHINWEWRSEMSRSMPYKGIVIEIPRRLADGYEDDHKVHRGEYWAKGPISLEKINRVWEYEPYFDNETQVKFIKRQIK